MNKTHLIYLAIGIGAISLLVGVADLGITLADVKESLNLVGEK